jgi:LysM repeat protein
MKARRWVFFIGLNVVISVLTTLAVLSFKGALERIVVVTVTPAATSIAHIPTAIPAGQGTVPTASLLPNPTAPPANEYVVQAGDTLLGIAVVLDVSLQDLLQVNGLTEESLIHPGQVLIIPTENAPAAPPVTPGSPPPTETPLPPTPFPTETPTPPGPVQVRVQELLAPGELEREGVVIVNRGRTVNLAGWTLGAVAGEQVYVFPRLTLAEEVPVTVYTIAGDDSPYALHWGLDEAQWGQGDTIIELRDAEGDLIATYAVP